MRAPFGTARLSLAPVREADRESLIALERDPEVMRFLNGGRPTPDGGEAEGASFLTPRGGEDYVWAARERRSGAFVGWFSLRPAAEGAAELGYRLRRDAWGRGLASEGASGPRRQGIRRLRPRADRRDRNDGPRRLAARPGEGGAGLCADRPSGLARRLSREASSGMSSTR